MKKLFVNTSGTKKKEDQRLEQLNLVWSAKKAQ